MLLANILRAMQQPRAIGFVFLGIAGAFMMVLATAPQVNAAWGSGGSGTSGGGGYYTTNGFGWKKFNKYGGGPDGGFRDGTPWWSVQAACAEYSGDSVWVHVVRNSSGSEKSFNYSGAWYNRNRPTSGADPYVYNAAGNYQYQGAAYQQHVIDIVGQVKSSFMLEHSAYEGHWGVDVAWFCDGPKTTEWTINGQSYIQNGATANKSLAVQGTISATPGDRLNWYHDMRNNGPDNMDRNVYFNVDKSGFSNGWNGSGAPNGWASGGAGALFVYEYAKFPGDPGRAASPYTLYDVTQNDVGNTLCQRIAWNPGSWNDTNWFASGWACANVPYNYSLVPSVTNPSGGGNAESDQGTIAVSGNITNNGPTKSRTNIDWQLTQIDYPASASIANKSGGTGATACSYFTGESSCNVLNSGTESSGFGYPNTRNYSGTGDLSNKDLGTQVCFVLSVRNYQEGASDWKHSALSCIIINKKPKVQVLGGDLWVGRGSGVSTAQVVTGRTQSSGTYYGSWSEYGIVAPTTIRGMASAAGYSGGSTVANFCTLSLLTFANTTSSGSCDANNVGGYAVATSQPIAALSSTLATRTTASISGTQDIASLAADTEYSATGDITLTSSADVPKGKWVVISAPGRTVTIASNITYTNVITKDAAESSTGLIGELPQVVIIAANIVINESVSQVDAWLAATDTVRTCSIFNVNDLGGDVCGTKLTVNGPVITDNLLLYRTAGAGKGAAAGDPAEVFNLRPDAYLWATALQNETARVKTVQSSELPPRY